MALTKVSTGMLSADLASVDLNIDANTLYIDVSNNRVGINNTGPATALDVTGTVTADGLTISAPSGDTPASIGTTTAGSFLSISDGNTTSGRSPLVGVITDDMVFYTSAGSYNERMRIDANGLVQIGTTSNTGGARVDVVSNATSAYTARSASSGASTTVKAVRSVDSGAANFANAQYDALSHAWVLSNTTQAMTLDASANLDVVGRVKTQSDLNVYGGNSGSAANRVALCMEGAGASRILVNGPDVGTNGSFKVDLANSTGTIGHTLTYDASGNVGIGTSSPAYITEIAESQAGGVGPTLYLHNTVDNVATGHAADIRFNLRNDEATSRNAIIRAQAAAGYGSDPNLLFLVSAGSTGTPQEAMRIDSSGHAIIPAGVTLGTTAGTYNADNTLDDYEEGVFSGTVDGTTYSGEYTKVGNLVTISCYYDCSAATNNRIAIVPFACSGVVSTQNSGAGITASTSATHPEGTSACVFGTTANVYAYSYARATLGTPSTGNGSFQFTYYTTE